MQTACSFVPQIPQYEVAPKSVEEYQKVLQNQFGERQTKLDFRRFSHLNEQFLLLQSIGTILNRSPNFEQMRSVPVNDRTTLYDLLQKSTVMDRPNEQVFTAVYGVIHAGFLRAEDFLEAINSLFAKEIEPEQSDVLKLQALNLLKFFIELVLPFNKHCTNLAIEQIMCHVPQQQQGEYIDLINTFIQEFNNKTNNATSKQSHKVVVFQHGSYQIIPLNGDYIHKPRRFVLRHNAANLMAIDPLEFAQFITHKVAFIIRELGPFEILGAVFDKAGAPLKIEKIDAVHRELDQLHEDLKQFVRSFISYDQFVDQALTWFLLLCKNLRELNNFQTLKTVIAALTEEAHPEVFKLFQGQMNQIPELMESKEVIPAGSIRANLVVPTAIPIKAERFINPKLKTILEDCLQSCGIRAVPLESLKAADLRAAKIFPSNKQDQYLFSKGSALSYRVLYSTSADSADAQKDYLNIMSASAPPVVYDLDFVLFILQNELNAYRSKKTTLEKYLSVQAKVVNLAMNLKHFTFNFDDHNDEVLEKLLKTLMRCSDEELVQLVQKATAK